MVGLPATQVHWGQRDQLDLKDNTVGHKEELDIQVLALKVHRSPKEVLDSQVGHGE